MVIRKPVTPVDISVSGDILAFMGIPCEPERLQSVVRKPGLEIFADREEKVVKSGRSSVDHAVESLGAVDPQCIQDDIGPADIGIYRSPFVMYGKREFLPCPVCKGISVRNV